jgi:hypothetical protein
MGSISMRYAFSRCLIALLIRLCESQNRILPSILVSPAEAANSPTLCSFKERRWQSSYRGAELIKHSRYQTESTRRSDSKHRFSDLSGLRILRKLRLCRRESVSGQVVEKVPLWVPGGGGACLGGTWRVTQPLSGNFRASPSLAFFKGGVLALVCGVFEQYLLTNWFTKHPISANISCDRRI